MEQTIYIGLPKEQPRPVCPRVTLQTLAQWAGPVAIENTRYNMYNTKYSCQKSVTQVSLPTRPSTDAGTMGGPRSNRKYNILSTKWTLCANLPRNRASAALPPRHSTDAGSRFHGNKRSGAPSVGETNAGFGLEPPNAKHKLSKCIHLAFRGPTAALPLRRPFLAWLDQPTRITLSLYRRKATH